MTHRGNEMDSHNRPFFLQYDIPETRGRQATANPSDELWREGCVRITLSCWLVMERDIPYEVIDRLRRAGCRVHCLPFDVSAKEELRAMATENIRREIEELVERARTTRAEAETRLADESDTNFRARRNRFMSAVRAIETRVNEMAERVGPAAERFGITADMIGLTGAVTAVQIMGANMRERARVFGSLHGILHSKGDTGRAISRAVRAKQIPMGIVADFLQDNDDEQAGEELRNAFGASF